MPYGNMRLSRQDNFGTCTESPHLRGYVADGYGSDDPQYEYQMMIPPQTSRSKENTIIQENYNRIRRILGWSDITL